MRNAFVTLLAAALSLTTVVPVAVAQQSTWGFPYDSQKVRGVNLGGWLVLEPWITPSLFDNTGDDRIIDEWTYGLYQDKNVAYNALKQHWDTWITEDDFRDIAAAGLNHVRLPIGYWAFEVADGEPYIQGQLDYLDRATTWASKYNLKVIVDLHGAPGSQNGFDNSGQKMDYPTWHTAQSNVDRTNAVLKTIAGKYKDLTGFVPAIAPLNEPAGFFGQDVLDVTRQYWEDSYNNIRFPYDSDPTQQSNTVVIIHDAFQPLSSWNGFLPYASGLMIDTHIYNMFDNAKIAWSEDQHIQAMCARASDMSAAGMWTLVGEWTPARTDCAKYLNGRGIGSRYEGTYPGSTRVGSCAGFTGSASGFSDSYKTFLRKFWEAQVTTYEKGVGWMQWTWKAEQADDWSYQAGLLNGFIPQNPAERLYPNICG
ncbi:exo-beta-1,3-glucanase [Coprinopsis sp. MPI-PUGE-AT-0042]|nr:exo-beta-1,3-glucanase [Coprinopsis sp. MPI-PUGE-AT-0042]